LYIQSWYVFEILIIARVQFCEIAHGLLLGASNLEIYQGFPAGLGCTLYYQFILEVFVCPFVLTYSAGLTSFNCILYQVKTNWSGMALHVL